MTISDELVEAFVAAVPLVLQDMGAVEAFVRGIDAANTSDRANGISVTMTLSTSFANLDFVLHFRERTAVALAERILTETIEHPSADMVRDCVGEVANVIAGQAKSMLVGNPAHFTLSTPTVRDGRLVEPANGRAIDFDSSIGEFSLHLCQKA